MIIQGSNESFAVMFATKVMDRGDHQYKDIYSACTGEKLPKNFDGEMLPASDKINRVAMRCNFLI